MRKAIDRAHFELLKELRTLKDYRITLDKYLEQDRPDALKLEEKVRAQYKLVFKKMVAFRETPIGTDEEDVCPECLRPYE